MRTFASGLACHVDSTFARLLAEGMIWWCARYSFGRRSFSPRPHLKSGESNKAHEGVSRARLQTDNHFSSDGLWEEEGEWKEPAELVRKLWPYDLVECPWPQDEEE